VPLFELVIALLLVGAVLSAWARHISVPYPALLALAGAGLALLPRMPGVMLDPELALALFVAPVLLDAAFDSSPRDLKRHWRAVVGLAVAAVGVTIAAVAAVAHRARRHRRPARRGGRHRRAEADAPAASPARHPRG